MGIPSKSDPLGQFDDNSPIKEKTRAQYLTALRFARTSLSAMIPDNQHFSKDLMLAISLIGKEIKEYE